MIASSSVVLANLAYLIGAVVLAVVLGLIVWARHRKPKSIDANVESFNRGLRALAPDRPPRHRDDAPARASVPLPSFRPAPLRSVRTTAGSSPPPTGPSVLVRPAREATGAAPAADRRADPEGGPDTQTRAEEAPGRRSGAEPG